MEVDNMATHKSGIQNTRGVAHPIDHSLPFCFPIPITNVKTKISELFVTGPALITISPRDADLVAFEIWGKPPRGDEVLLFNTEQDFLLPTGALIGTSGDITSQAAGTHGWIVLESFMYSYVLYATSSAATDIIEVHG